MGDPDVGLGGVAASLSLVAVAVVLSNRQGLGFERTIVWSAVRAFVQLLAVGSALTVVLDDDAPVVLAEAWVVAMVVIAAFTVHQRARHVPGLFVVALLAIGAAEGAAQVVLFAFGVLPFEPVAIVPLAGMVIGNSLLAGVDPVDAVLLQVVVMYLILGGTAVATAVVGVGVSRRLFTPDHRLVRLAREA